MRYLIFPVLLFFTSWLTGQEAILDYQVEITILTDADIEVTENITVRAEGNMIQRGIYRSIPTIRPDEAGRNEPAPIKILTILRDGQPEDYHTEKTKENLTIYIGNKSHILEPGVYTYQLTYRSSNQIGYFEEYDELYWNVIGPDWAFPIHNFGVKIKLPDGADYLQGSCYTGRPGSTASNCMISAGAGDYDVVSRSDQGLRAGEGFTVAVAWPKGFVEQLSASVYSFSWINLLLYGVGLIIFIFYGYRLWQEVGMDPPAVSVVPDWHPPEGLSPAEMSYVHYRKISTKAISAALVSAAIKGAIRIENKRRQFTFQRIGHPENLEVEERAIVDRLLPPGTDWFELKSSTYKRYESAKSDFNAALRVKLRIQDYFKHNWKEAALGSGLLALIATVALSAGLYSLVSHWIVSSIITFLLLVAGIVAVTVPFYIHKWYKWLIIIPVWMFSTVFFTMFYVQLWYYPSAAFWAMFIGGLTIFLAGYYNYLIFAPTEKGQQTTSAIKGFRMYLDKSEKAMLEYFTPPEQTPELFEKMLPFAIALGVENRWGKKFKKVLDEAIEKGTYAPIWYAGNIHQINTLHSNFQTSVSHAAPKSSSGSGGGGFSGGGGGGGGGGGW